MQVSVHTQINQGFVVWFFSGVEYWIQAAPLETTAVVADYSLILSFEDPAQAFGFI